VSAGSLHVRRGTVPDTPPLHSLVTLALQNALLAIIMHYSRVSTPSSQAYSAAAAVLMNELLKGSISLAIAFARLDVSSPGEEISPFRPTQVLLRCRRLVKEVFSADCWKLSIPAILYGELRLRYHSLLLRC
jgi:UDP-sugar transporter A1/2/3